MTLSCRRLLPLLAAACLAGCAPVGDYFYDRGHDLADVFKLNLGVGLGLDVNARATRLVQAGLGTYGSEDFDVPPVGKCGLIGREFGIFKESRTEIGIMGLYYNHYHRTQGLGNVSNLELLLDNEYENLDQIIATNDRSFDEIGAMAHALLIGADAGVRPVEFLDFLGGLFTLDFMKDDNARSQRRLEEKAAEEKRKVPAPGAGK